MLAAPETDPSRWARLRKLAKDLLAAPVVVSFGDALEVHAARVLCNGLQHFLRENRQLIAGPFAFGRALGVLWRLGSTVTPPAAGGDLRRSLLRLIRESAGGESPAELERLIVLLGYWLPIEDLEECIEASCNAGFVRAAGLLLDRMAAQPDRCTAGFLLWAAELLKRNGAWMPALRLVRKAAALDPGQSTFNELAILEKTCGNFDRAIAILERRLAEDPEDAFLLNELLSILPEVEDIPSILARLADRSKVREIAASRLLYRLHLEPASPDNGAACFAAATELQQLAPECAPQVAAVLDRQDAGDRIEILQLGRERRDTPTGILPVLCGIEAVRVRAFSSVPLVALRIRLDGRTIGRVAAKPPLQSQQVNGPCCYLFNVWINVSPFRPGLHVLQLYFEEKSPGYRSQEHAVLIDREDGLEAAPQDGDCGTLIPRDLSGEAVYRHVNDQPSLIASARREGLGSIRRILVIRADQLGDFVVSIPAINRLRELFPEAVLVGLIGRSGAELARQIGCFAEIIPIDFPFDIALRRRTLPLGDQIALQARLREFSFDLAVDLCESGDSRPLLRLSGARFTAGFNPHRFPWLSLGLDIHNWDKTNNGGRAPHATTILSLVETIGTLVNHRPVTIPPTHTDTDALAEVGVEKGRYIVLHTGARHAPQRWPLPHYMELARLVLAYTGLKVVLFVDDAADAEVVSRASLSPGRVSTVVGQLEFRKFDALISHCAVFVGNDSGPKHLAALRGVKVVSIHAGRVPWGEWGQEGNGLIVTRRVPCWGCLAETIEECGQDLVCLTCIKPEEVLVAIRCVLGD